MIRIEAVSPVLQRRWCPRARRHVTRPVQQFVRYKIDARAFKRSAPRKPSLWPAWAAALFRRSA